MLKKDLNIIPELSDLVEIANEKYEKLYGFVYKDIMENEIYIKETIVPITAKPLEVEKEKPTDLTNPEGNPNVSGEMQQMDNTNQSGEKVEGN